jgi:hypothetical protein
MTTGSNRQVHATQCTEVCRTAPQVRPQQHIPLQPALSWEVQCTVKGTTWRDTI